MNNYDYKFIAPARINLIGEHIDYNGGYVLPSCIDMYLSCYISKRNDNKIVFESDCFKNKIETNLDDLEYNPKFDWAIYSVGVFYILKKLGFILDKGLNIEYKSKIPAGSGLSSSAAILDVTFLALKKVYKLDISNKDIAIYSKMVENDYCKLKSGIMDEAIIALGRKNTCLLLNCDKFEYEYIDISLGEYEFVVLKTNKPRKLIESKYNERVEECESALSIIKSKYNVSNLCSLKGSDLLDIKSLLNNELLFKRVSHVVKENERVFKFCNALKENNYNELAKLLNESQASLKNDYETTGYHLDTICDCAIKAGALGARSTGAGFGGCAIALIKKDIFNDFKDKVKKEYYLKTNIEADIYEVSIVDGIKEI